MQFCTKFLANTAKFCAEFFSFSENCEIYFPFTLLHIILQYSHFPSLCSILSYYPLIIYFPFTLLHIILFSFNYLLSHHFAPYYPSILSFPFTLLHIILLSFNNLLSLHFAPYYPLNIPLFIYSAMPQIIIYYLISLNFSPYYPYNPSTLYFPF